MAPAARGGGTGHTVGTIYVWDLMATALTPKPKRARIFLEWVQMQKMQIMVGHYEWDPMAPTAQGGGYRMGGIPWVGPCGAQRAGRQFKSDGWDQLV